MTRAQVPPITDTCLVIPLYNEGQVISDVIHDAQRIFPIIICVDDGSTDDSVRAASDAGAIVIQHPLNMGQGAALQTGITYALKHTNCEYIATFDADGQHDPEDVLKMLKKAKASDLSIVFGSRFLDGKTRVGPAKKAVLKTAALVTRMRTGLKLTDAHNGLRVLRRDAASQINMKRNRMAHASEIVGQLADTGLPWAEMPVDIRYTDYSKAKGQSLLNSVNILVELVLG